MLCVTSNALTTIPYSGCLQPCLNKLKFCIENVFICAYVNPPLLLESND